VHSTTNSEQMDIDALSNSNRREYLDNVSDCESESDSIKTQNYLEDLSHHNNLSSRSLEALRHLVQENSFYSKKMLYALSKQNHYQSFADEIISHIITFQLGFTLMKHLMDIISMK
jgi:hypothetical protein